MKKYLITLSIVLAFLFQWNGYGQNTKKPLIKTSTGTANKASIKPIWSAPETISDSIKLP